MIISRTPFRISFAGGGSDLVGCGESEVSAVFKLRKKSFLNTAEC